MLAPPREYTSAHEIEPAARAIRARLFNPPPRPVPDVVIPEPDAPVQRQRVFIASIIKETCLLYSIEHNQFMTRKFHRFRSPRHNAMVLAKHLTTHSFLEVGRRFNGNHATVWLAMHKLAPTLKAVADKMPAGSSVAQWVLAMRDATEGNEDGVDGRSGSNIAANVG